MYMYLSLYSISRIYQNLVNGNIYSARITDVKHYGFMLQLLPDSVSTSCLLHASQVDKGFVDPFKYGYKKGDEISVKYLGRNKLTGRLEVSRKALLAPPPLKKKGRGQTTGEKGHVTGGCVVKEEVPIDTIDKDITDKQVQFTYKYLMVCAHDCCIIRCIIL